MHKVHVLGLSDESGAVGTALQAAQAAGLDVTWADAGSASARLARNAYDAVLLVGDGRGLGVLRRLRSAARGAVIIALVPNEEAAGIVQSAGADDAVVAPWTSSELTRAVQRAAELARTRRALRRADRENARLRATREAARDLARDSNQRLATLGHELRTPLAGMIGVLRELQEEDLSLGADRQVRRVLDLAELQSRLCEDLLLYTRLEEGRVDVRREEVAVRSFVEGLVSLWTPAARRKGLLLEATVAADVPEVVTTDPVRLHQVMANLLTNAVKFTAIGRVTLAVETAGERVRWSVSDTGVGVAEHELERLFQPFTQANAQVERTYGGSGMGLSICHRLVGLLGGRIQVSSRAGEGTRFWFELPVGARLVHTSATRAPVRTEAPARSLTVLVADDSDVNRAIAVAMLEREGHRAISVADGAAAVEAVQTEDVDVVLMDLHMPVMDGYAAIRRIRALGGRRGELPIVALTAAVGAAERSRAVMAGADAHLTKPMDRAALRSLLAGVDQGRREAVC